MHPSSKTCAPDARASSSRASQRSSWRPSRIFDAALAGGGGVIERGVGDDRDGASGVAPVVEATCRALVDFADVRVVCHRDGECVEALRRMSRGRKRVVDLVGLGGACADGAGYVG